MRLAMLGPYPADLNANKISGGVQAVIVNMVKGLARFKDMEIHVVTADPDALKEKDFTVNGIKVYTVPLDKRFGNITFYANTRKRISRKIDYIKPDIVHTHMFGYYTLASLDTGHKKVIVSTHGISNIYWHKPAGLIEMIRYGFQGHVYNKCARKAKRIIVNSPYTKRHLAGFKKTGLYELNNPVSSSFFDIDNNAEEKGRILFAGYICEEKGVMTIMEAFSALKKTRGQLTLDLVGKIVDDDFYMKACRFVKANKLEGSVRFLGQLNENDLMDEYRRASVFVFPSKQDVAPLSVLQAMASSKAIAASDVGGIPYILDNGINGFLVDKDDSQALADKISLFLNDEALAREFGSRAREKVFRDHRIDVVTDRLYKIYREVLDQKD